MKEDTKQLETLSYKPICSICQKASCQCRTVLLKENLAKPSVIKENNPIVEPRGCTDCETPGYCGQIEQPNTNLKIIEDIEGLMSKIVKKLENIDTFGKPTQTGKVSNAFEEIDLFQKTTLFELRKAFE